MATPALQDIETQFAHLSASEQLALLERLARQMRPVAMPNGHPADRVLPVETADPRFRREWDSVNVDFRASGSDLLSEA